MRIPDHGLILISRRLHYLHPTSQPHVTNAQTEQISWWCSRLLWYYPMWNGRSSKLCHSSCSPRPARLRPGFCSVPHGLHQPMVQERRSGFPNRYVHTGPIKTPTVLTEIAAIFFSCATISGSFGCLIAYGIETHLSLEKTGRSPWSWLFLIEGILAICIGIIAFLFLPRLPDDLQKRGKKHWLFTKEEIDLAASRFACE